jgi:hypothetical protein
MSYSSLLHAGFVIAMVCLVCDIAMGKDRGVMLSHKANVDFALTADPESAAWKNISGVTAAMDPFGKPLPEARTEIRSRWTEDNLYFLFTSNYQTMYLKPNPSTTGDTWGLWDYDVVEVFIGHDLTNIQVYKEFEISPQSEFIDLDVDRNHKSKQVDADWNSNMKFRTRVDKARKIWFCEMQIPWKSIAPDAPSAGKEMRLNLYRIEGAPPNRKFIVWQQIDSPSFHTPERFGRLRLAD